MGRGCLGSRIVIPSLGNLGPSEIGFLVASAEAVDTFSDCFEAFWGGWDPVDFEIVIYIVALHEGCGFESAVWRSVVGGFFCKSAAFAADELAPGGTSPSPTEPGLASLEGADLLDFTFFWS